MIRKRGEGSFQGPVVDLPTEFGTRGMKRSRGRRREESKNYIERENVSETFRSSRDPKGRLCRVIVFCSFLLQAVSFIGDRTPRATAFVPRSQQYVSTGLQPFSTTQLSNPMSKRYSTKLFGIKGFRAWFDDQFPNAACMIDVSEHQDTFDHVLIDMNQILHVVLRRSRNTEQATKLLMVELDNMIQRCKPTQSLVLAIDGSAAAAKMATQRKRRYSILKNTEFKLRNADKLRLSKRKREKRLRNYKSELQSLQLTPGTDCMKTMESAILYWAWQRLQNQGTPYSKLLPKVRIYISSSQVPGEGEIKLLEWINNYRSQLSRNPGQSIALFGGDADLVLEAMVIPPSWTHNVFVMRPEDPRPAQDFTVNGKKKGNRASPNKDKKAAMHGVSRRDVMHCTSLWEIILSLDDYCRKNISQQYYNPEERPDDQNLLLQIRTDMVLLFILNGNDYLPRVVAVGFRSVLKSYLALLENWIGRTKSIQNVGLVDPNTLNFRSDFCAEFFRILGARAPSEKERNRALNQGAKRTFQSVLNDMSAIGFTPTPVRWYQVTIEEDELHGEDVEEDVDDDEDEEDDDFDDDIDDDYDEDLEIDENQPEVQIMELTLGSKKQGDFHRYRMQVNSTSSASLRKAKMKLSKMALKEFDLLDHLNENFDSAKDYDWEIEVPAKANIERYLAGLIWTLHTYQDGVCPTYQYNYGKCLAPSGREISSYFIKAMDENRDVGMTELLSHFEPGGSISAGVACLAALPVSVKETIIPKPYSLLDDQVVEDIYTQCMDPTDNFFHMKKFETLVESAVDDIADQIGDEFKRKNKNEFSDRQIVLGDHYWTVLQKMPQKVPNPFKPPPPPVDSFSRLRANNRIKAGRIICMDIPSPRNDVNRTMPDSSTSSNYPRKFWEQNSIPIDHLNFGSLINGSKSSVLDTPYKVPFGSSPKKYGKSPDTEGKSSFELLKSESIDLATINEREKLDHFTKASLRTPDKQTPISVLKYLKDAKLVTNYTFRDTPTEYILTVTFDEANGSIPLDEVSFSFVLFQNASIRSIRQYLSAMALEEIMYPGKAKNIDDSETRWFNLTPEDMKAFFARKYPGILKKTSTRVNPENSNSPVIFNQLSQCGLIKSHKFSETAATQENPLTISLSVDMSRSYASKKKGIFLERNVSRSKKWTRQHLMSLALDAMILESASAANNSTEIHWYDLSFREIRDHIAK